MKNTLSIHHISVVIDKKKILDDASLEFPAGKVSVLMGPNGSGKSTLAKAIMGGKELGFTMYDLGRKKKISINLNGEELLSLSTEVRAKKGLFLAFQNPVSIPGVSVVNLLRSAYQEKFRKNKATQKKLHNPFFSWRWSGGVSISEFLADIKKYAEKLAIKDELLHRGVNEGYSGGERKKIELLQALILKPEYAIFDEIDTGLDVDALQTVSAGIETLRKNGTGIILITHYQRILKFIHPDRVYVLVAGRIVEAGNASLSRAIEKYGYKKYQ